MPRTKTPPPKKKKPFRGPQPPKKRPGPKAPKPSVEPGEITGLSLRSDFLNAPLEQRPDFKTDLLPADEKWVISLLAAGFKIPYIVKETGVSPERIRALRKEPRIQNTIIRIRDEVVHGQLHSIMMKLAKQAGPSIDTLADLRDTSDDDSVRLRAAQSIMREYFDHMLPKRDALPDDSENRKKLDPEAVAMLIKHLQEEVDEAEPIDITPEEDDGGPDAAVDGGAPADDD